MIQGLNNYYGGEILGGKEAIRGFMYQGFASILEALTQKKWDKIYVEYPSEGDKVDIALESDDNIIKSIQVKSSINLFSKGNIIIWIKDLIVDVKASEYEIVLIGACDKGANDFINSIDKYNNGIEDKKSKAALKDFDNTILDIHNINIKILPMEESSLQSIVRDTLNKYISYKGYTIPFECLELIAESTISTHMLLGTNGNSQSKYDFDFKIFKWIELTSGGQLKSENKIAKHDLMFYKQESKELITNMDELHIYQFYNYKNYINKMREECIDLINKIDKIKLQTYKREKFKQDLDISKGIFGNDISLEYIDFHNLFSPYSETSEKEKDEIIHQIKLYFNIDIEPEFFYVGNLREEEKIKIFGQYDYEYHGTKEEKVKNEMINRLKYKLLVYETTLKFVENLKMCSLLPIVIKNVGEVFDKNITVKLFIEKESVKVYQLSDYPVDDYLKAGLWMFCDKDNITSNIFKFNSDSNVLIEDRVNFHSINEWKEVDYDLEDFYNELKRYIAEIIHEDEKHYIIEFEVKDIRANEIKFLDRIVMMYPLEKDIELKYRIISDHSDGSNEGVLKIRKQEFSDR